MKTKIIITLIIGTFLMGCAAQQNLTWTPTPEEWAYMTPTERNQWYMSETTARQARQQFFRDLGKSFQEIGKSQPTTVIPLQPPYQPNYWQEELARQQYWDRLHPGLYKPREIKPYIYYDGESYKAHSRPPWE